MSLSPKIDVETTCPWCGKKNPPVTVSRSALDAWKSGAKHIQDAFPELNADDRELLQTGICPTCWDESLGDDD